MRTLLLTLFLLVSLPAFAGEWSHYLNPRFGYRIDIPPDFEGYGESANGDGQVFELARRAQTLTVWGGNALDGFDAEVASAMAAAEADAWNITYQATTPKWASFSGVFGKRVLYERIIALCGGTQFATFQLVYSVKDIATSKEQVERLVHSLEATNDGLSC